MAANDDIYYREGIPVPETPIGEEPPSFWKKTDVVGKPLPRVDAYERVSGTAQYPSDILLPGMLYGAILRSPHPHARVKKLDVAAAEKMEGVRAVLTESPGKQKISHGNTRTAQYLSLILTAVLKERLSPPSPPIPGTMQAMPQERFM